MRGRSLTITAHRSRASSCDEGDIWRMVLIWQYRVVLPVSTHL